MFPTLTSLTVISETFVEEGGELRALLITDMLMAIVIDIIEHRQLIDLFRSVLTGLNFSSCSAFLSAYLKVFSVALIRPACFFSFVSNSASRRRRWACGKHDIVKKFFLHDTCQQCKWTNAVVYINYVIRSTKIDIKIQQTRCFYFTTFSPQKKADISAGALLI